MQQSFSGCCVFVTEVNKSVNDIFSRTELLYGKEAVEFFRSARVAVFGIGGVGGHTVEALARSGIGKIDITDSDIVTVSNINRQIIATTDSVGENKVDVMKKRILSINPECEVNVNKAFILPDNADEFDFSDYDYVVDAIDTVSGKMAIIKKAYEMNIPVISSMGAGNKLDPTRFAVSDIYKTSVCPLAKVIRKLCRENNIKKLKVVWSDEMPVLSGMVPDESEINTKRAVPGSNAIVPAVAGLIMASEVLKDLAEKSKYN